MNGGQKGHDKKLNTDSSALRNSMGCRSSGYFIQKKAEPGSRFYFFRI